MIENVQAMEVRTGMPLMHLPLGVLNLRLRNYSKAFVAQQKWEASLAGAKLK